MQNQQHPADQILENMTEQEAQNILDQNPISPTSFSVEYAENTLKVIQHYDPAKLDHDKSEVMEKLDEEIADIEEQYEKSDHTISVNREMEVMDDDVVRLDISHEVEDKAQGMFAVANFVLQDLVYMEPEMSLSFMHDRSRVASVRMLAKKKLNLGEQNNPDYIN